MTYSTTYTPYGDYLLDWDLTGADGSAMLDSLSGGDPVRVTVSTPKNDHGDQFCLHNGELKSNDVAKPTEAVITFDTAVTDLKFQLKDVDQGWDWDDKMTVLASDADGNPVDVEFSGLQAGQTESGNTIDGGSKLHDEGVTVSIAGPVAKLVIIHDNGESEHESGHVMITDMGFNAGPTPDGIVEGTAGDDLIDLAYDGDPDGDMVDAGDAILTGAAPDDDVIVAGAGNDTVYAGAGDDLVFGGSGDDELDGDKGDDTIYGDGGDGAGGTTVRESLNWSEAPNFGNGHDADAFTQNTGNVDVSFSILKESWNTDSRFETTNQNIDGIEGEGDPVDATSSFESVANGKHNEGDYQLGFSDPVSNVSFRVNDIDGDGVVRIIAYDADDNMIPVELTGGSKLTLLDTDGVAGADTADSKGGYLDDDAPEHSLLVDIAGPVSRIVIEHDQNGGNNSGVNITDVFFDVEVSDGGASCEAGNDTIDGGEGDDLIYGEGGDDQLTGGEGDDTIYGDYGPGTPGAPGEAKVLVWEDVASDGTALGGSTDYDAGGVNVNIAYSALDHGATGTISDDETYTEAGEGLDSDSSLELYGTGSSGGFEETSLTTLEFSSTDDAYGDAVQNVFFRLNDVDTGYSHDDHIDRVTVRGYDAEGNEVDVVLTPTGVQDVDDNTVTGTTEDTGSLGPDNAVGSVEVAIAGPVERIEILYENGEDTDQAIWVSDVTFETTAPDGEACEDGDDVITGGAGADVMHGEGGDDTFIVASGDDGAGDEIIGGNGPDDETDHDVLDLSGSGKVTIDKTEDDTDSGAYKGTVTFENGSTLSFSQIEEILTDPQNEAPVGGDDHATTDEDTAVVIDVLANDTDVDGDTLEVTEVGDPANGTAAINGDGTITYTPDADYNGPDSFTYTVSDGNGGTDTATVTIDVTPVNDDPVGVDDHATTDEDTAVVIDVLANDSDVDGDTLEVTEVGDPANGTAAINGDGTITYTPDADYNGSDSFTYTVSDGNGGTDTATVTIDVTPVNDAPVAEDDADRTPINTPTVIAVLDNDSDPDGDPLEVISASSPDGSTDINADGTITFTPDTDFFGETTIDYTISDGNGGTDSAVVTVMVNDGIVSGTDGDDLIDLDYDGDPEGDMVDANDAILPGDAPNDDVILAGDGDDTVFAGVGDDHVKGGAGDDVIHGEGGDDTLIAGDGSDTVYGGAGDDVIDTSGSNPMTDYGYAPILPEDTDKEDDRDFVDGGDGDDTIFTGDDRDTIDGGAGDDYIDGGLDDDLIEGGDGDDEIIGGHGSDDIDGGAGDDLIYGGLGPDLALDPLNIPDDIDPRPDNGIDVIHGGAGDDTIFGQDDADMLYGDEGDDYIDGGIDNDTIFGGEGDDELLGGQGDDRISGGAGNDTMTGGDDRDTFINVNAGDVIDGSEGGDDFDTLDLTGSVPENGSYTITYTVPDKEDGFVSYFDEHGDAAGTLNFTEIENIIPCFTPGTMIATPKGERRVEELKTGDRVITRDNGIQEIKWVGHKPIGFKELALSDHLKPVLIRAGALGNGLPERDMMVSPNHRVLVANDRTTLYFDEREVLAAAKHLVDNKGILSVEPLGVTYVHFMFDHHEVVLSDGAWTESFQPGDYSLKGIGNAQRQELFDLFPELETQDGLEDYTAARRILKKHEARMLIK
ncbi:Ig-like domain-containing protein [Maritimibacter sp. HL-12]|uniref:Ig-like domain-containing protein n=1 Tax=Maritimibacter sp. HL-12 TaxID=1162418 RepID=UPI000A0EF502|nr:Ig-like domain-containing protein [Maritimibacter sp. HL-12]SMH55637.1 Hint domain-containing protein [Maritimibacter sp. HL-12]